MLRLKLHRLRTHSPHSESDYFRTKNSLRWQRITAASLFGGNTQGDLESVASLFGRITALQRGGDTYPGSQGIDEGAPLDAHVRVVMRMMKERLGSLKDGPLQAGGCAKNTRKIEEQIAIPFNVRLAP